MRLRRPTAVGAAATLCAAIVVALLPFALSNYHRTTGATVAVYFIAILALDIVTGYTGQISIGHGAFMAIGGYTTAILTHDHGWNDLATLPPPRRPASPPASSSGFPLSASAGSTWR